MIEAEKPMATIATQCCVVGGGPAGMMVGYLLARAGVSVVVFEKHADFLRDFRGDTVHPSTMEVMHELGLLDEFLQRPLQKATKLTGYVGGQPVMIADFTHLKAHARFIALMPQWEFLDFLSDLARQFPHFQLRMETKVTDLIEENGRVVGVKATAPNGLVEIRCDLVIGADGRHSIVRERAGLEVQDIGAPIDVLWMRLSRRAGDPDQPAGRFDSGKIFVMIDRGDYWQCAYVIPKGGIDQVKRAGLPTLRQEISRIAPFVSDRVGELRDWDDIKLLTVVVDRLRHWSRPGLLCIGDAAHAMSPVGGVGINLAVQDAVAAANILARPLLNRCLKDDDLKRVQRRRTFPTKMTQWMQVQIQKRILSRVLASTAPLSLPWPLKLVRRFPVLSRLPARLIGIGFRPEHVRIPIKQG